MSRIQTRESNLIRFSVGLCFFLSGAAGLVYEIIWMRMLGLVFGHTVFAMTTVLAAFMAGLALGAFLFGGLIDQRGRPLQIYGWLEAAIGLYALLVSFLFAQAQSVYLWLYRALELSFFTFTLAQFALVFIILLVPTTLMGASLPVLAKFYVNRVDRLGQKIGDLYALNTFGAVVGSAAAGFLLLPAIGVKFTTAFAAAINLGIGAWMVFADRRVREPRDALESPPMPRGPATQEIEVEPQSSSATWLILTATALSGAASMVYEVAWTRALRLVIGSSIYAFSAMLTTFLVGLALGSFLFARIWGKRKVNAALFGWLELAVGFSALALVPAFESMPDLVVAIFQRFSPSPTGALLTQFVLSFAAMIIPTTIIGATFPCAVQICARALSRLGRDVSEVYAANTAGTIAGALVAGFALVPWIGAQSSMTAAAALNIFVGVAALAVFARPGSIYRWAVVVAPVLVLAASVTLVPQWDRRVMMGGVSIYIQRFLAQQEPTAEFRSDAQHRQLLFYREGLNSTVAVERTASTTSLKVDGKVDASNGMDMMTQIMSGHLPLMLHPRPEQVLVIGFGSGVTAGAVAQHPTVRQVDVVELEPAVLEAADFFSQETRQVLRNPKVRAIVADGRNFILASTKRYDVITSEPSNPWMAGVANLFSLEFYRLVRERLRDDGIMVQWFHGYSLFPREMKMIINTFRQVFPHATLWRTITNDYLMVGRSSPLVIDYALLNEKVAAASNVQQDLAAFKMESPLDILSLFYLDEADLARFSNGAPINTDDKPLLEFAAPLALYADTGRENVQLLRRARSAEFPPIVNLSPEQLEARRFQFARFFWSRGEREEALAELRKAPFDPRDFASSLERAKLLFSLGEINPGMKVLRQLAQMHSDNRLVASYLKAGAILQWTKGERVIAHSARTQLGNPNPAEAFNNLGLLYIEQGIQHKEPAFFDLAVDALETALRVEPESYSILNSLGNAYFELSRLDEAAHVYRQIIRLHPNLAEVRFNLGLVYEKQERYALAVREYENAVVLKPSWGLPRVGLERLHNKLPRAEEKKRTDSADKR